MGDFVLKHADSGNTYQLAVVLDAAAQSITHVVRGMDLADNTVMRQQALTDWTSAWRRAYLDTAARMDRAT